MSWRRIRRVSIGAFYAGGQCVLGQMLHPYKTVRGMVRDKVFLWLIGWPILTWLVVTLVARLLPRSWYLLPIPYPASWIFLYLWLSFFALIYQSFLLYLLVRFIRGRSR